jgi:chromosome partitioning protein
MLIVALTQTKGGSGKSTLAQCISVEAARKGKKVLLVDLDPAQAVAKWWRRRSGPENPMIKTDVKSLLAFTTMLESKSDKPDVMVLDTPGEILGVIRAAIAAAHVIVVPMAPSIKDWEAMDMVEALILKAQKKSQTVYVINRFRAGTETSIEAKEALRKRTGAVPQTVALAVDHEKADAEGETGAEINRKIAGEIGALWEEIKRIGQNNEQKNDIPAA